MSDLSDDSASSKKRRLPDGTVASEAFHCALSELSGFCLQKPDPGRFQARARAVIDSLSGDEREYMNRLAKVMLLMLQLRQTKHVSLGKDEGERQRE